MPARSPDTDMHRGPAAEVAGQAGPGSSTRPPRDARLSRRAALVGACAAPGLLLLAGCTADDEPDPRARPRRDVPTTDPDVVVAAEALLAVRGALTVVEATTQRHAALAGALSGLADAHRSHVAVLDEAVPPSGTPEPTASPGSSDADRSAPRVPADVRRARAGVAAQERALSAQVKQLAFRSRSGPFARLLAGVAACAAQHAAALDGLVGGEDG